MKKNLSAIKRTQVSIRNRVQNKIYKSAIKVSIKKFLLNFDKYGKIKSKSLSIEALSVVYKKIDKAISKGVIHKNKGSRQKSRLAKLVK